MYVHYITVLGIEKETGCEIVLGTFYSKEEADEFCKTWNWLYDDGVNTYDMKIVD